MAQFTFFTKLSDPSKVVSMLCDSGEMMWIKKPKPNPGKTEVLLVGSVSSNSRR